MTTIITITAGALLVRKSFSLVFIKQGSNYFLSSLSSEKHENIYFSC